MGITGKITSGLLTINGLASQGETLQSYATIDTLSGDLHLQSLALGGINILNGRVTIDTSGNLKLESGSLTAKVVEFEELKASDKSSGHGVLPFGATSIEILTSLVSSNSKILITPSIETGGQSLIVKERTPGIGFKVLIEQPYASDITLDWLIVN